MAELHPPIQAYATGTLPTPDGQSLYWESVGQPSGVPVLVLHGGPGTGCTPGMRRWFDPGRYRAVLFDQRGCGRSRPLAKPGVSLDENNTWNVIDDIERLRQHLGIEAWMVVGSSWGSTLALAYAQTHPQKVTGLVLGPVTAGTRKEVDWITRDVGRIFPREWENFVAIVPPAHRGANLAAAYARILAGAAPAQQFDVARRWCAWEDAHVSLAPGWRPNPRFDDPDFALVFATLVTHYWAHDCFLPAAGVFPRMAVISHIPGVLVHGRYDVSGPAVTAWELHKAWPDSRLVLVDDAGHGGGSFINELVAAIDELGYHLSGSTEDH
jgi:proline iminopeptidase